MNKKDEYKDITISLRVRLVEKFEDNPSTIARIHYPDEGSNIAIIKGLNIIELDEVIHHEIGHLIDWYLSQNNQKLPVEIREKNADIIGNGLQLDKELRKELNELLNEHHKQIYDKEMADYEEINNSDEEDI